MLNETISTNYVTDYISYLSKTLTQQITDFLIKNGFNWATVRWTSNLLLAISLILLLIGFKYIVKPIIKLILIILAVLLIVGIFIPW